MRNNGADRIDSNRTQLRAHKALWFVGLYVGGVIVVASLSYALRALVL